MSQSKESELAEFTNVELENRRFLVLQSKMLKQLNDPIHSEVNWQQVCTFISEITKTERAFVAVSDETKGIHSVDFCRLRVEEKSVYFEDLIGRHVMQSGQSYCCNNVSKSELLQQSSIEQSNTRNIISVPLTVKGKILGAVSVINKNGEIPFYSADLSQLEMLGEQVALTIDRDTKEKQLERANLLLSEVHHRLKNNLSTIISLIEMEIEGVDDKIAEKLLQKTIVRIASMMQVHDLLNNKYFSGKLDLKIYFDRLIQKINSTIKPDIPKVEVKYEVDSILVNTKWAINCGLLLNELLVNCYKHAFASDVPNPQISIRLRKVGEQIQLDVSDNGKGIGFESGTDTPKENIGVWLIDLLLRSLEGTMDVQNRSGCSCSVNFSKSKAM